MKLARDYVAEMEGRFPGIAHARRGVERVERITAPVDQAIEKVRSLTSPVDNAVRLADAKIARATKAAKSAGGRV